MNRNLTALLGILAVAGYQNRDKINEILKNLTQGGQRSPGQVAPGTAQGGLGDILGNLTRGGGLGDLIRGGSAGGILSGGLGGLVDQLTKNGRGDVADSWVKPGPNQPIESPDLADALGDEVLSELTEKTGLSREEIVSRLSRELPRAVDDLTPDGRVPDSI
ncbi:hypothetical protein ATY77_23935 [Rhizobium sp. R634]|uniref:YidB family protein n=1 Tax=Rhizobium sp. R634 TaxID=1764274 RepID=UPI000B532CE6|nr:YidB family protein [Rhizobium sp. R634]OWV80744.1 hypothetical protein ATY77_23935 [Rhizobium sp. R634]